MKTNNNLLSKQYCENVGTIKLLLYIKQTISIKCYTQSFIRFYYYYAEITSKIRWFWIWILLKEKYMYIYIYEFGWLWNRFRHPKCVLNIRGNSSIQICWIVYGVIQVFKCVELYLAIKQKPYKLFFPLLFGPRWAHNW